MAKYLYSQDNESKFPSSLRSRSILSQSYWYKLKAQLLRHLLHIRTVRNFPFATRIVCRTGVFRTMTFGKQPRQVTVGRDSQFLRRIQTVIALRKDIWLKTLTKRGGGKRVQTVLRRDTITWLVLFLELNPDGSDLLFGTSIKYTCMFRSVLKTAWKSFND